MISPCRPDQVLHAAGAVDGAVRQAALQEPDRQRHGAGRRRTEDVQTEEKLPGPHAGEQLGRGAGVNRRGGLRWVGR